jgi:hypothetical protein
MRSRPIGGTGFPLRHRPARARPLGELGIAHEINVESGCRQFLDPLDPLGEAAIPPLAHRSSDTTEKPERANTVIIWSSVGPVSATR